MPDGGCVIAGPNGSGKTSFIEALLYGEVFRSVRGGADRDLVRFGADGFHVRARGVGRGTWDVGCGFDARTKQKKVTVDGVTPRRLTDAIGRVCGVMLSPLDVTLVAGGPRERRRYLDVLLSLTVQGYVEALGRYRRAVAQRLRASPGEMPAWESLVAQTGAAIATARQAWAGTWAARYRELCFAIGEKPDEQPQLEYRSRAGTTAAELAAALERSRERDRQLGRTSVGPHRDELRLLLGGRELRSFGSAGQQRTAAMALRFLEADTLESGRGEPATLCLDDAFAELDDERSRRLAELVDARVASGWQVVAAVPRLGDVPEVLGRLPRWRMTDGAIATAR